MLVSELESLLFSALPKRWAEPWDRVGLLVGNPAATVQKIALALDASPRTVRLAAEAGANVLLTHHPVCLSMPDRITPDVVADGFASKTIWNAISLGVSVMSFHTNLDRSPRANVEMPRLLGLNAQSGLEPGRLERDGRLGSCADLEPGTTLRSLATDCRATFGAVAQVFGPLDAPVTKAGFFTGSLGDCGLDAVEAGCDVVVCGECGYHKALDLVERGCGVVVLGHDVSELPLVGVLDALLDEAGIEPGMRFYVQKCHSWEGEGSFLE